MARAADEFGLIVVPEGFADRAYEDDGRLVARGQAGAVLTDGDHITARAVEWARTGNVPTGSGARLPLAVRSLCVHGDTPGAAGLCARLRLGLEAAGVHIRAPVSLTG
jgi:UPF0271 protein